MSSNLVKHGAFDLEAAEQEEKELNESTTPSEFLKIEVGRNVLRFLPPPPGKKSPFRIAHEHFIDLPGGDKVRFACPRMMTKAFCPACQKADELRRTGNARDRNRAFKLYAKRRVYANVINRKNPDAGVQIYAFGKKVYEALIGIRKDAEAGGDFTHPDEGFDIIIGRKGTGMKDTEYSVKVARNSSPLGNDEWITQQYDLDVYTKVPSAKEAADMMAGKKSRRDDDDEDDEDSDWEEADEKPARRQSSSKPAARTKTAQDDAFEDEAEPSSDDEDDEDDGSF